jgi:hypothetical protein
MISQLSEGIPRNINNICFNALSLGCSLGQKTIDAELVQQVAADFDLTLLRSEPDITTFDAGTISLAIATSEARSLGAKRTAIPIRVLADQQMNPEKALAYLQDTIQRLKNNQPLAN